MGNEQGCTSGVSRIFVTKFLLLIDSMNYLFFFKFQRRNWNKTFHPFKRKHQENSTFICKTTILFQEDSNSLRSWNETNWLWMIVVDVGMCLTFNKSDFYTKSKVL